jgi:hypothetical protein
MNALLTTGLVAHSPSTVLIPRNYSDVRGWTHYRLKITGKSHLPPQRPITYPQLSGTAPAGRYQDLSRRPRRRCHFQRAWGVLSGRTPLIVDDIVSTVATMIVTVNVLRARGHNASVCIGVHAIFAGNAFAKLKAAGPAHVATVNTVKQLQQRDQHCWYASCGVGTGLDTYPTG